MDETKQLLKKVKRIEIKTKKLVDGLLQGAYHSIFKGRGIEFSEVREYVPGDDVRIIDWKVTSRMNHPYVKEFIEERDLTVYILFDVSGSKEFGSTKTKKEAGIELAASLMFAALKNQDKVGLCLFAEDVELFRMAKKGRKHILNLIHELLYFKPKTKTTNLNNPLRFISKIVKRKSILFVISDFLSPDFSRNLSLLRNKHDIVAIHLSDEREHELPDVGYIRLEDEETGEQIIVNTSDKEIREAYKEKSREHHQNLFTTLKKLRIDNISIKSHEPFEIPLRKFFHMRTRRLAR